MTGKRLARRRQVFWAVGLSVCGAIFWWMVSVHWMVAINRSPSLPQHLFIVHKGEIPDRRGEFVAFYPPPNRFYPDDLPFIKIVRGLPGDMVRREGDRVFVGDEPVARIKAIARNGLPLEPGPVGVVPPGHLFVATPHPDGLDSRYAEIGWVPFDWIIGKAHAIR